MGVKLSQKGEFAFSNVQGRPRKESELLEISIKKAKDVVNETEQELARLQKRQS